MLISPPVPEIQLFKRLTLKIQGQGHGWGQSSKSQCESNIPSTHIPLVPCQSALPFLRYSIFKILPWKFKVKVIAQGHKVGITPYRLISLSFHVDRPSHSWDTAISKFDVENSRSRSWVRSKLKVTTWVQHSVDSHPFRSMSIGHPIPELWLFKQDRLKRRNTLGCLDRYAAQNSKYARPPIPSHPPTQKVFFQWHTQYDPTMKHSHCETVYAKELFQWLFFELVHSLRILSILSTFKLGGLTKECQWCT